MLSDELLKYSDNIRVEKIIGGGIILIYDGLKIDLKRRQVWKNNQLIPLRRKEFEILIFLAQHPEWVYTKEQIYKAVWEEELPINIDNAVSCQIKQLRKKLGNSSEGKPFIETVWGVGYKFNQK